MRVFTMGGLDVWKFLIRGVLRVNLLLLFSLSVFGQAAVPDVMYLSSDLFVVLERTECFGTCPAYKITVSGDGRVVYEGFKYVKTLGKNESTISWDQIQRLVAAISKSKYFDLRSSYVTGSDGCTSVEIDTISTYTTVYLSGAKKTVSHSLGCAASWKKAGGSHLKALTEFEDEVERIVDETQWIGTENERKGFAMPVILPQRSN